MKIVKNKVVYGGRWDMAKVIAEFEDGTEKMIFEFFPDEINFNDDEFVGMTEDEAYAIKRQKDIQYLRS